MFETNGKSDDRSVHTRSCYNTQDTLCRGVLAYVQCFIFILPFYLQAIHFIISFSELWKSYSCYMEYVHFEWYANQNELLTI